MLHPNTLLMITSPNVREHASDRIEEIKAALPGYQLLEAQGRDAIMPAMLEQAEIVFGPIRPEDAAKAPRLRWVQLQSAGCEPYTRPGNAFPHDRVTLTTASGVYDLPIAEHVIGFMLGHVRGLFLYTKQQVEKGTWTHNHTVLRDFSGSTVGVIGLGSIGTAVAVRARALGATVLGMRRTPSPEDPVDACYTPDRLHEMLRRCDFVALCLPSTTETARLLDEAALAALPDHAYIVNIGRGSAIDTNALVKALQAGTIGGAGLDVTDPEPLPDGHPLWTLDNVVITPHTSGGSPGDEDRIHKLFLKNIARYRNGDALENTVDPKREY